MMGRQRVAARGCALGRTVRTEGERAATIVDRGDEDIHEPTKLAGVCALFRFFDLHLTSLGMASRPGIRTRGQTAQRVVHPDR